MHRRASARKVEHIWVTRDGSRRWPPACSSSPTPTHLPSWIERRPGQVVVQTWHGIGFKRVAFDMDSVQFANPTYLERPPAGPPPAPGSAS
jgi:CDP-glycerol glycerophosphotransferase